VGVPRNGDKHQEKVALPSLASALPKHFLMKLPLLSSEPDGFHLNKKPLGTEGQRYSNGFFMAQMPRFLGFSPGVKRISSNRRPLTPRPSPQENCIEKGF